LSPERKKLHKSLIYSDYGLIKVIPPRLEPGTPDYDKAIEVLLLSFLHLTMSIKNWKNMTRG
jgi:hypothetical protein